MSPNIRDALAAHIEQSGVSMTAVARQVGKSPATLSNWLAGKYRGNVERVAGAVAAYLQRQEEKAVLQDVNVKFVETTTSKRIFGLVRLAHLRNKICVLTARAGSGKTVTLQEYTRHNPSTLLIESDSTYTKDALLREMHKRLGFTGRGVPRHVMADIIEKLTNSDRLIIIDEADQLSVYALEVLRAIHDKAHVGMVLAGMPRLIENIRGLRGELEQFYSRVVQHLRLEDNMSIEDAALICHAYLTSGVNGTVKTFHSCARGNPRMLTNLIGTVIDYTAHAKAEISKDVISDIAKTMIV